MTLSSGHGAFGLLIVVTPRFSTPYAHQPHRSHQPFDGALGHLEPLSAHLVPDLARAIEAETVLMDTLDVLFEVVIATGTGRTLAGIGKTGGMLMPGGRGDLQFAADRLDPQFPVMPVPRDGRR